MDKSKPVSVRLSNNEQEAIENFIKQNEIKSQNDFFRFAAAFTIGWINIITQLMASDELNSKNENFRAKLHSELEKIPKSKANLKEQYDTHEKEVLSKIDEVIDNEVDIVGEIFQKRSAGRPPNPKAGPGRPKDTGY